MMDPPPFQHFFEHFQQPMIWLRSGWKHSKISDCIQTEHAIDCATAPIFPRGPTDTVRFDYCGSPRSEIANAATRKGAVRLSSWKHSNRSICWTARCQKCVHKRLERCDPFFSGSPTFRRSLPDLVIAWIFVRFLNTWGSTLLGTLPPSSCTPLWTM